jgi:RNA polymerase sigma factor (TIGR02999 family)
MDPARSGDVTGLLIAWSQGNRSALDLLMPQLYDELRKMAHGHMRRERAGHTLQTTALVNEVYLRLVNLEKVDWQHRAQFFALSAEMMRRILVDAARARLSRKRGKGAVRVTLDKALIITADQDASLLALNDAMDALAKVAPRQARVVELRYFSGMTEQETAEVLKTSPRSVNRDWHFARAWLMRQLSGTGSTANRPITPR